MAAFVLVAGVVVSTRASPDRLRRRQSLLEIGDGSGFKELELFRPRLSLLLLGRSGEITTLSSALARELELPLKPLLRLLRGRMGEFPRFSPLGRDFCESGRPRLLLLLESGRAGVSNSLMRALLERELLLLLLLVSRIDEGFCSSERRSLLVSRGRRELLLRRGSCRFGGSPPSES